MQTMVRLACVTCLVMMAVLGCARTAKSVPAVVGGPCAYKDIPGWARVVSIRAAPAKANNCPNHPVVVRFDFIPDDPKLTSKQAQDLTLTVAGGMNPARAYITAKGIAKGKTYRCVRREIMQGTCTPVLYTFPKIDLSDFGQSCYPKQEARP